MLQTVGDCYVACAGLPMPRKDHALIMCRFANEILEKMHELSRRLETVLGPDTADVSAKNHMVFLFHSLLELKRC